MSNFPFLSVLTVAPLVGALVVAVLPRRRPELAKQVAFGWSLLVLALSVVMWLAFKTGGERLQFRESYTWIPQWDARFTFAADGIALVMLMLIAVLVPLVILASWHDAESSKRSIPVYFALLLVLESTMIGVFAAADVFLFYVFFEVMLVPMYFLIGSYGGHQRQYAAVKFFLYSLVGGLFMLAAVIGLWVVGGKTFDWQALTQIDISTGTERWLFLGFFLAFAIKAPFFPFHTWLPDAGGAAPAGAAALLVGVLDKVGTFGILRYCLPLFPEASKWFAPYALALGVIGIIYAALLAVGQNDLKRLVSYTSIAHFGFIGVGIFAFTTQAGTGAVLYMLNHGLATGLLFLVVGMLVARRGSALISDFGGAGKLVPLLAGVLFFAGLASLALPGTAPFVSEFLVLIGTFTVNKPVAVIATLGIILAAAYVLWMVQRTTQGTLNPALTEVEPMRRDLNLREKVVVAPLIALIVLLGFYPKPVTDVINPAVRATMEDVGRTDPAPEVGGVVQEAAK
ncbi:NADH-quinone oxidoreductase subunit M [Micromonospora carbonacea]|uniref:NADH-quinone oxidoreductase subunit M n=2 Tax=Micromonospora TaxID=1873 RepID=A0A0D0X1C5_9ACTN|nr:MULTISPECIES: NADH-quinone oxidoreductase subunit M [Micromonospora]KIR64704.1 NADH-quinone oxidoreductase subunit M [Micromonospora haikouensis]MBB5829400.1 NADH-quinone oxidoreductase subunit M [Micromonospora carbonacea]OON32823.1 NADH-quinone oxidoreductase subunit M [Micromonospora sp. Rc5]QLD23163.1 NADH-quinone oxidoreductase subunit M [Micromonospora carbonacea]SCF25427.1 NADH dehydrogenase subunit M [Micromonospora carbonacea]